MADEYIEEAKKQYDLKDYNKAYNSMLSATTIRRDDKELQKLKDLYLSEFTKERDLKEAKERKEREQREREQKASEEKRIREEKARKKKEGVVIGMSKQDVLDSSWGKPQKINRTTTSYGVHEQWVYNGYNYLYFEDDKLVSIQN